MLKHTLFILQNPYFTLKMVMSMRYSDDTLFLDLLEDPEVIEIAEELVPGVLMDLIDSPILSFLENQTISFAKKMYPYVEELSAAKVQVFFEKVMSLE